MGIVWVGRNWYVFNCLAFVDAKGKEQWSMGTLELVIVIVVALVVVAILVAAAWAFSRRRRTERLHRRFGPEYEHAVTPSETDIRLKRS
jgi:heme/copper-type cytochrome/quinol oxidase subunit 2